MRGYNAAMRIIAVTNIKGGVGKTTTAVNLAYLAAASGRRTLLWDLDSQGAATWTLRVGGDSDVSVKKLVNGDQEIADLPQPTGYANLDALAADPSLRNVDRYLQARKNPVARLLKLSRGLRDRYDLLFLDCPPGMSMLSENILHAADALVIPCVPAPLATRMLTTLSEFVVANGWSDLVLLPFFSMVDRRRSLHGEEIAATRNEYPQMLTTEVPYWSEIERMTVRRAPLPAYAPASAASAVYSDLLHEIESRLPR
jgi:cellulose biosynthesis protein BcsQ